MTMDGKEIFMFAVKRIPEVVRELMEKLPITANDIDTFVLPPGQRPDRGGGR